MANVMKLKIHSLEDRLTVASIFVKNGYTVSQVKMNRSNTSKAVDYYLVVTEDENNVATIK